jgi:NADH:ubiquinone oxidoreductase subunit 4 (subunit M)
MSNSNAWFVFDSFNGLPLILYTLLFAGVLAMLPRQDARAGGVMRQCMVWLGTVLCYASNHYVIFWAGWLLSLIPLFLDLRLSRWTKGLAALGICTLGAGLALLSIEGAPREWAFALLMISVAQRKGLFPFQGWLPDLCERGDLWNASLLFNGHLGVVLVARIALPQLTDVSRSSLVLIGDLGLFTAVLTAVLALSDRAPRRLLALVATSQAALILAGLEEWNEEAILGALLHWMVVTMATTALMAVLRLIEVRQAKPVTANEFLGLGAKFPRLAVFFAVSAMAMVGLPGTLGFASEDLLIQGSFSSHPWIGLAVPVATALNAISLYRLFARIFLGAKQEASAIIPDATPRERAPLALILVALVLLGLLPQVAVNWRRHAAETLTQLESKAPLP